MGTPISGKDGNVKYGASPTDVADVTNWKCTLESDNKKYASSDTGGNQDAVAGIKKWSGSFDFKVDDGDLTTVSAVREGTLVPIELKIGPTGVSDSDISGNARIKTIEFETDVEGGEIIGGSATFTGDGAPVRGSYSAV